MTDIVRLVSEMSDSEKAVAVRVLDAVSRPLTVREIEAMLRCARVSRSNAKKLSAVLRPFKLIAVVGPEAVLPNAKHGAPNVLD